MTTELQNFYQWWTEKVKGNYIDNDDFERLVIKFDRPRKTINN